MTYMDKYPVEAWFRYHDKAVEYAEQNKDRHLVIIVMNGGYALIAQ